MAANKNTSPVNLSLRGRLRFLLKDSAVYGGATGISKVFALITFPLIAREFSVAEFGILDYFIVLSGFLCTFLVFGQDSAVARFFYEDQEKEARKQLISQSLFFQLGWLILFMPILWLNASWLTSFMVDVPNCINFFKIILLQSPFMLFINFSQNLLKWTFDRRRFLVISLGFTAVQSTFVVIAITWLNAGVEGVMVVTLITSAFFGFLGLFFVRKWLVIPVNFQRLREMMSFALPYGVIGMLASFLPTMERSITESMLGADDLGLYAAAVKITMLIGVLISAFQTAWGPFSLALHKEVDAFETYNWIFKMFALGMCLSTILLSFLAPLLIHFLTTDRYNGAVIVVFPLVIAMAIQATGWISEIGIGISKQSHLNLYAYGIAISATFCAVHFFAPKIGLLGVGLGVLIGQMVKALITSFLAQQAYPLPWRYAPVVLVFGVTLFFGLVAIGMDHYYGNKAYLATLCIAFFVVGITGWHIIFDKSDRQYLLITLRRQIQKKLRN